MDVFTGLCLAVALGSFFLLDRRWANWRLDVWARRGGAEILSRERRYARRGPFDFLGGYAVFRVRIRDAARRERVGWVRLGDYVLGLCSDEAHARWDKSRPAS
ncbi:MAG TPA: hypothetical protein VF950_20855 [Planctomycetota bacterium]